MLTFEKSKTAKPVAIVTGGRQDKRIIYLDENEKNKKKYSLITELDNKLNTEININDGSIFPLPDIDTRSTVFVSGPSGSGKSTFVSEYTQNFKLLFPKNDVYLFSKVKDDPAFRHIKKIIKIPVDEKLMSDGLEAEDVKNSLCIFDDIDTLADKKIQIFIDKVRDDLLEVGRHKNVYMLNTGHQLLNWKKTKIMLMESGGVVFFPKSGGAHAIKTFLSKYAGLDKQQIDKVFKINSRWVFINKQYPMYIVSEHKIYLIQ